MSKWDFDSINKMIQESAKVFDYEATWKILYCIAQRVKWEDIPVPSKNGSPPPKI